MAADDDPILELAAAFVVEKFHEMVQAQDPAGLEAAATEIAALIVGPHKPALAEYAAGTLEHIAVQKAQLQVNKRDADKKLDIGRATAKAALDVLVPPNRQQRRRAK